MGQPGRASYFQCSASRFAVVVIRRFEGFARELETAAVPASRAVGIAAAQIYSTQHNLKSQVLSQMLDWEVARRGCGKCVTS